jgi:hypothetical protein
MEINEELDSAKVGKMFVTSVNFQWNEKQVSWNNNKEEVLPGHWIISATLNDKPQRYSGTQTMSIKVEHGIGQKLAEILLPVVIADASKKAQQLADDSKAMFEALGNRTIACLTDMPEK